MHISTDSLNTQLVHSPAELRMAITPGRIFVIHPKNARFITVQRQWFTVFVNVASHGFKIRERGL